MKTGIWVREHRKALLTAATVLLSIFLPLPGLLTAALFWPGGIHDLDSTRKVIWFVSVVVGVSGVVWAAVLNALLPRRV